MFKKKLEGAAEKQPEVKMSFSSFYEYVKDPHILVKRRSAAALKNYESAEDTRAWSMDKFEKSNFIHDVVTKKHCNCLSDDTSSESKLAGAVKNVDLLSKDELVKQIKDLHGEMKV